MTVIASIKPILAMLTSLVAVLPISLSGKNPDKREFFTFVAAIIKFGIILSMVPTILSGTIIEKQLVQILPGLSIVLRVDGLSMLFALVASSLWIVTSLYAIGYMRGNKEHSQTRFFSYFALSFQTSYSIIEISLQKFFETNF